MIIKKFNTSIFLLQLLMLYIIIFTNSALAQFNNWPYESDKDKKYIDLILFKKTYYNNKVVASYTPSIFLNSIAFYQRFLSKGQCQFYPSCSRYAYKSIQNLGIFKGLPMAVERLSRCHPWAYKYNDDRLGIFLFDPVRDFWRYDQIEKYRTSLSLLRENIHSDINSNNFKNLQRKDANLNESSIGDYKYSLPLFEQNIPTELQFACFLYKEKNFFRAVTEFKRNLYLYPNYERNGYILLLVALSFYQSNRYSEAQEYLKEANLLLNNTEFNYLVRYLIGLSHYSNGNYRMAIKIWKNILKEQFETPLKQDCIFYLTLAHLKIGAKPQAIYQLSDMEINNSSTKEIVSKIEKRLSLREKNKSPLFAGILSSVLPGSGQIYSGRFFDGITSFTLTGLFTFLTIDSYKKNYTSGQFIGGMLGLQFYLGNIFGAKRAAYLYTEKILDNVYADICKIYNPSQSFDIELKQSAYFLIIN